MRNIISDTADVGRRTQLEAPVNLGKDVIVGLFVKIGRYSYLRDNSAVGDGCEIGRFCSIARGCEIGSSEHPTSFLSTHPFQYANRHFRRTKGYRQFERVTFEEPPAPKIGHDVWIGAKATIMRGVNIGHGAVIAAGAVVTKDVPPYTIVAGVPAKPLRKRFPPEIVERLLAAKWWDRELEELNGLPFDDIERCLDLLEQSAQPIVQQTAEPAI